MTKFNIKDIRESWTEHFIFSCLADYREKHGSFPKTCPPGCDYDVVITINGTEVNFEKFLKSIVRDSNQAIDHAVIQRLRGEVQEKINALHNQVTDIEGYLHEKLCEIVPGYTKRDD